VPLSLRVNIKTSEANLSRAWVKEPNSKVIGIRLECSS